MIRVTMKMSRSHPGFKHMLKLGTTIMKHQRQGVAKSGRFARDLLKAAVHQETKTQVRNIGLRLKTGIGEYTNATATKRNAYRSVAVVGASRGRVSLVNTYKKLPNGGFWFVHLRRPTYYLHILQGGAKPHVIVNKIGTFRHPGHMAFDTVGFIYSLMIPVFPANMENAYRTAFYAHGSNP